MKTLAKPKKTKTTPFDSADYLHNEADCAAYLDACFEESNGDPAFMAQALGTVARAQGMGKVAKRANLSRENLYKALSGERAPTIETFFKVAEAIGVRLTFTPMHRAG